MVHENINVFIGVVVDLPTVYILSNYCAKGSLQVSLNLTGLIKYTLGHTL